MKKFDTKWAIEEWQALVEGQRLAPDWPYEGQSYYHSDSACDARCDFWRELEDFHGEEFANAVKEELKG